MGTMQWLDHFRSSVRRERNIHWELGVHLPDDVREPVLGALQVFQRGLTSPGLSLRGKIRASCSREYAECIDLYVMEKQIHSELLVHLLWEAGSKPARRAAVDFMFRRFRRRFDWARELSIVLTAEIVSMPLFRVICNNVDDPIVRQVMESIMADQAYHLGFHIDHLRPELQGRSELERLMIQQAWGAFFTTALTVVIATNRDIFRALGYDRLAFWTDAWNLFAQVQTGLNGSNHLASVLGRDPRLKFAL